MNRVDDRSPARYGRNPGWAVTGLLAFVYGVAFAFRPALGGSDAFWDAWAAFGAVIVGICFVVFLVVPFLRWVGSRR